MSIIQPTFNANHLTTIEKNNGETIIVPIFFTDEYNDRIKALKSAYPEIENEWETVSEPLKLKVLKDYTTITRDGYSYTVTWNCCAFSEQDHHHNPIPCFIIRNAKPIEQRLVLKAHGVDRKSISNATEYITITNTNTTTTTTPYANDLKRKSTESQKNTVPQSNTVSVFTVPQTFTIPDAPTAHTAITSFPNIAKELAKAREEETARQNAQKNLLVQQQKEIEQEKRKLEQEKKKLEQEAEEARLRKEQRDKLYEERRKQHEEDKRVEEKRDAEAKKAAATTVKKSVTFAPQITSPPVTINPPQEIVTLQPAQSSGILSTITSYFAPSKSQNNTLATIHNIQDPVESSEEEGEYEEEEEPKQRRQLPQPITKKKKSNVFQQEEEEIEDEAPNSKDEEESSCKHKYHRAGSNSNGSWRICFDCDARLSVADVAKFNSIKVSGNKSAAAKEVQQLESNKKQTSTTLVPKNTSQVSTPTPTPTPAPLQKVVNIQSILSDDDDEEESQEEQEKQPIKNCKHENAVKSRGTNQYQTVFKCNDCGETYTVKKNAKK